MIHSSSARHLSVVLGLVLLVQGCSAPRGLHRPQPASKESAPAADRGLSAEQRLLADASCFGGVPRVERASVGPTELVIREGYVLDFSSIDKISLWVCESVSAQQLLGHVGRRNVFAADPDLKGSKSYPDDYAHSGYDRGHQAPAGNQTIDQSLKDQTFYMSNMAPQRPSLNRGIWKQLEDKTRTWVIQYGHAYEWTGPIVCDVVFHPKEACVKHTIGHSEVSVPESFYKIILVQDHSAWKAIAFVLPNADFHRPYRLETYITSIEWIERQAGIEFMPDLSVGARRALVSKVSAMWP